MSAWRAVCPQCRREVVFISDEKTARCPGCGFTFELQHRKPEAAEPTIGSLLAGALKGLAMVVLIMAGLAALALGVAFVGCIALAGGIGH
jgi:DNA-directed RNA polymerase subunit RPC12/RpoP